MFLGPGGGGNTSEVFSIPSLTDDKYIHTLEETGCFIPGYPYDSNTGGVGFLLLGLLTVCGGQ